MSFIIKSVQTGMVLDVEGASTKHGAEIILYPYHGNSNQLWIYNNGMIISKMNGYVLDFHPKSYKVILSNIHRSTSPKWRFDDDLTISNKNGKVLDAEESGTDPCTSIIAYPKHGGENQQFFVVPYDEKETHKEVTEENVEEEIRSRSSKKDSDMCSSCSGRPYPQFPVSYPHHIPMFPYMYPWFSGSMNCEISQLGHMQCPYNSCLHHNNQMAQMTQFMKNTKLN